MISRSNREMFSKWWGSCFRDIEGELCFIKTNMLSNIKKLSRDIKTTISMMGGAVAKKDTRSGAKIHFVTIVRTKMGKT